MVTRNHPLFEPFAFEPKFLKRAENCIIVSGSWKFATFKQATLLDLKESRNLAWDWANNNIFIFYHKLHSLTRSILATVFNTTKNQFLSRLCFPYLKFASTWLKKPRSKILPMPKKMIKAPKWRIFSIKLTTCFKKCNGKRNYDQIQPCTGSQISCHFGVTWFLCLPCLLTSSLLPSTPSKKSYQVSIKKSGNAAHKSKRRELFPWTNNDRFETFLQLLNMLLGNSCKRIVICYLFLNVSIV